MKSKGAIVIVTVLSLALTAGAVAKTTTTTYTEKGKFNSGDGSVVAPVTLKVTMKKVGKAAAKPTKVSAIVVKTLNYRCPEANTAGKLDFRIPGPLALKYDKVTKTYSFGRKTLSISTATDTVNDQTLHNLPADVFLKVAKNGKRVDGEVELNFKNGAGQFCGNGVLGFTVRK
jgi:hypothetical protein